MNTVRGGHSLMIAALAALVLCLPPGGRAQNLIANADFAKSPDEAWTISSTEDEPAIALQSGEPNAISVRQALRGYTVLSQLIPIKTLDLDFSFSAMFVASVNKPNFTALSEVVVGYYSADTGLLGQTRFCRAVNRGDLKSGPDQHLIPVKADSSWDDYTVNLKKDVMDYLSAVKPSQVALIKLSLSADNGKDEGC